VTDGDDNKDSFKRELVAEGKVMVKRNGAAGFVERDMEIST
jgi:hypothetical protein